MTVSDSGASIWALGVEADEFVRRPFGPTAHAAWDNATVAVTRSLAVLWRPPPSDNPRDVCWLDALPASGNAAGPEPALDGRSFGLSFFLAITSTCLDVPLKQSVAATAEIRPDGTLQPVDNDGLEGKILCVADLASRVSTFIVHTSQVEPAREIVRRHQLDLRIRGVDRAEDALQWALARSPLKLIEYAGRRANERAKLVEALFQATIKGRKALNSWVPVEAACRAAVETWQGVSRKERWFLRYVQAVAARHENNTGTMPAFDLRHVKERSADARLSVIANFVQHSSDTTQPPAKRVFAVATRSIPKRVDQQHDGHVRVMGAIGRLHSVRGNGKASVKWQKQAAELLFDCQAYDQASHEFAEWYRVAGSIKSRKEIAAADAMIRRMPTSFEGLSAVYVRLGRCQALVGCGRAKEACDELRKLAIDDSVPPNPRSSAGRWLIRALDDLGQNAEADAMLQRGIPGEAKHQALVRLDRALSAGHLPEAQRAVQALRKADRGPMRNLLAAAPTEPLRRARFVQAFFPY